MSEVKNEENEGMENNDRKVWLPILKIGFIAILYFIIGRISLTFEVDPENMAVVWPLSGIFLATILLIEKKFRLWLIGVLFLTDFIIEILAGSSIAISLFYSFSTALDASLSAWLLLRYIGAPFTFSKLKHVVLFLVISIFGTNFIAASISAFAPTLFLSEPFWESWKWWFTSHGIGSLLITPLILSWAYTKKEEIKNISFVKSVELAALFISIFLVQHFVFKSIQKNADFSDILSYVIFPFLIWAALRAGIRGVTAASVLLAAIILNHLIFVPNMFPDEAKMINEVISAQINIAIISVSSLFLASVVTERKYVSIAFQENKERLLLHNINSPLANIECDANFIITSWSGAAENIFGWTERETIGKSITKLKLVFEEDISVVIKSMEKLTSGKTTQVVTSNRNYTKSGKVIYCEWYNSVLLSPDGRVVSIMSRALDVTERKQAEEQQEKLTERINRIASNIPGAIYEFCLRPDGTSYIPYVSEGFSNMYGLAPEEVKTDSTPLFKLIHPDDQETFYKSIQKSAETLTPWHNESRVNLPSGEIIWIEGKSTPQKLEDGTILWYGYLNNVTFRKQAEKALEESEERLRLSTELGNIAVWEFDFATNTMTRSGNFDKLYGLDIQEKWDTKIYLNATHSDDRELYSETIQKSRVPGGPDYYKFDFRVVYPDDSVHWLMITGEVVERDERGEGVFIRGTLIDITDRKRVEEENSRLYNQSIDMFCIAGFDGYFKQLNPAWEKTLGWTIKELLSKPFIELVHPDDRESTIHELGNLSGGKSVFTFDNRYLCKDGSYKWISWNSTPLQEEKVVFAVARDITQRKLAEKELKKANYFLNSYLYSLQPAPNFSTAKAGV